MAIQELTAFVAPPDSPAEVPASPDWADVESELRLTLPADYRDFVMTYGSGLLGNFIRVFNPFATSEYLALVPSVERICGIRRELRATEGEEEVPYAVYPESPGIIPWGNDENGNTFYWLTSGSPGDWPTVVGEGRGRRWEEFGFTMTTFLAKALRGNVTCPIWPDDFPTAPDDYVFNPFRAGA